MILSIILKDQLLFQTCFSVDVIFSGAAVVVDDELVNSTDVHRLLAIVMLKYYSGERSWPIIRFYS